MKTQENFKVLKQIRKDLGWTQVQMAAALGLDPTYLSQLEKGRKPLDDFYLKRAAEIRAGLENSKKVKGLYGEDGAPSALVMREEPGFQTSVRMKCHRHIDAFLDSCNSDREQMAWTLVELKRRFPVGPNSLSRDEIPDQIAQDILGGGSNGNEGLVQEAKRSTQRKPGQ